MTSDTLKIGFAGLSPAEQFAIIIELQDIMKNNPDFFEKHSAFVCTDSLDGQTHAQDKIQFKDKVRKVGGVVDETGIVETDTTSQTTLIKYRIPKGTENFDS